MSTSSLQSIYNFWLKEENSIISNDWRNGRDVVRIPKATYPSKYGNFVNPNIEVEDVILKKKNTVKRYIKAPRMIYTKSIKRLHLEYLKEHPNIDCSQSGFAKYRPFYIEVPTEKENQSCWCIVCQNAHTKLREINTFWKIEKLQPVYSVTGSFQSQEDDDANHALYPKQSSKENVNYYIFESVLQDYVKEGVTKTYTRTTRVDKNESVCDIYADYVASGEHYLSHLSIVDNIKAVLLKIRESFTGKYIEMDFAQNIALKTKDEVQTAQFSGKQQFLHFSIVIDGNDALSYVYHLSDDTGHDSTFVDEVLNDIFGRWNIRNEKILLKSDNAGKQYKDKYAFAYYQKLTDKYNVRIIRLYGAAGHGKELIDAMSCFGVKSILRKDIVTGDLWSCGIRIVKRCVYILENLNPNVHM